MSNFDLNEVNDFIAKFKIKKSKIKPNTQNIQTNENINTNENVNELFNTPNIQQQTFNQPISKKEIITKPIIQQPILQNKNEADEIFGDKSDDNDDIFGGENDNQFNNGITNINYNQDNNINNNNQ